MLAALALSVPASASGAVTPARSADSFVDSVGVNTHLYYNDTPYHQNFGTVRQRLLELGVRHIRENLVTDRPDQYERLRTLAAAGVRPTLILGDPDYGTSGLAELTSILRSELAQTVEAVEGPNEWDLRRGGNWMSSLAPYQAQLYSAVKGSPQLSRLPVIGPSLGNTNSVGSDVSGSLDLGNIHSYPNAEPPEWNLSRHLGWASRMSASKPVMATETGYHHAFNFDDGHRPISEAAEATYLPRLFLEYFRRGVARTFTYELLDEFPDPGLSEAESNFGLLREDLTPKPSFIALRNLLSILAEPGASFAPGGLGYEIADSGENLHQLLLQKSNGSFYLALWRADSVWDHRSLRPTGAPSDPVTIEFDRRVASAAEFVPNASPQPLRALPAGDSPLRIAVGPQVVIVRIAAAGPKQTVSIKAWVDKRAVRSGEKVSVKGRLGRTGRRQAVKIQKRAGKRWKTIARSRTTKAGRFHKRLRMRGPRVSRIRVVAARARPSNLVRVRVLRRKGARDVAPARALD